MDGSFLVFSMKLQQHKDLKQVSWEQFCFEVYGPKDTQNEI